MKKNRIIIITLLVFSFIFLFLKVLPLTESLTSLTEKFQNPNSTVRKNVIIKLARKKWEEKDIEKVLDIIEEGIDDPDQWVRSASVSTLRHFDNQRSSQIIMDVLNKDEWSLRSIALAIVGENRTVDFQFKLIEILQNDIDAVRSNCSGALGHIGNEKAIPFLIEVLNEKNDVSHNAWVSLRAITGKTFSPDKKQWIAWWNKESKNFNAIEYEIKKLEQSTKPIDRIAAINRLWRLRATKTIPFLECKLKTEKSHARRDIEKALNKLRKIEDISRSQ